LRHIAILVALLLLAVLAAHCIPLKISPECQNRIDACLKNCPESAPGTPLNAENPTGPNDSRSFCERRCHSLCHD